MPPFQPRRIRAFLIRFQIRDHVGIMNALRAFELTSENLKSQNSVSAITHTISSGI